MVFADNGEPQAHVELEGNGIRLVVGPKSDFYVGRMSAGTNGEATAEEDRLHGAHIHETLWASGHHIVVTRHVLCGSPCLIPAESAGGGCVRGV